MEAANEQATPIDRLVRVKDWEELRGEVREMHRMLTAMGDRQIEMLEVSKGFGALHDKVDNMERMLTVRMWAPTAANTVVLLLNVILVLWARR